jgi:hypothetical protein
MKKINKLSLICENVHQSEVLTSLEHHFKVNIFVVAFNFQLQELNNKFYD